MPKDFAGRGQNASRQKRKHKPQKRVSPKQRVLFHGPSFATGALVGAAIVILAAYGPELVTIPATAQAEASQNTTKPKELDFVFEDMLKNAEVLADPEAYVIPEQNDPNQVYHIQVASFQKRQDAEKLRAQLLLENLDVQTSSGVAKGQRWYRVTVGPFTRKVEANRALNRLRQQGLTPILRG
jgi:cell division protein FtsN